MSTIQNAAYPSGENAISAVMSGSEKSDAALAAVERLGRARVGFVSGRLHYRGHGEIWTDAGLGRLIDAIRGKCCDFTAALCPVAAKLALLDHRLTIGSNDVLALPEMPTIARGFGKFRQCLEIIRQVEDRSDVVIVQLPFEAPLALARARKPRLYHVCADIWAVAKNSSRFAGWKRLPGLAAGGLVDYLQARLFHRPRVRVVTNGEDLREHYRQPPGRAVVSSTIREHEIMSVSRSRSVNAAFRILYVGYLRPEKGLDILLSAFDRVLSVLPGAELEIVGALDGGARGMLAGLEQSLAALGRKGSVRFLGHCNYGSELFQRFADADVLVVPSRMEGTPRVLVEARAFGCPVVATRVGGNPTSIDDGVDGLLIPPENSAALGEAIVRIARDRSLRERLVAGGVRRARHSTVEIYAAEIADELSALLDDELKV